MIDELEGKIIGLYIENDFYLFCDADKGFIFI